MPLRRVGVAVSGGRDSTALWHVTARAALAAGATLEVVGLHVHHGLLPEADAWAVHLRRQARRWAARGLPVRLHWTRLTASPARGDSVEAWARRQRYAALARMAQQQGIDLVLLAHHRLDQAETFLLQALRGAGPAGLAAMPAVVRRDGITWARPWLEQSREAIESYLRRHRLGHVDDPSNRDRRFARSRLRKGAFAALAAGFEQAEACLAAAARRAHEADACLQDLAALDRQAACADDGSLDLGRWQQLSAPRRANLLRAWLAQCGEGGVPESLVQRLLRELPRAGAARWPCGIGELRRHAGRVSFAAEPARPASPPTAVRVDLSRCGRILVPAWQGAFEVRAARTAGIAVRNLQCVELRTREGGESFQFAPRSTPRSLKKQFQAAGLAAWQRGGPLVWADGQLLFVPGLGIDARALAAPGQPMRQLRWIGDGA